jgi:capsular exopolysaccharide synthesis family protein
MIGDQEREFQVLDYWRVLVKRRWVILTSLIVVVFTVTLGSLLMDPLYTATTRLQIERSSPNVLPFQQVIGDAPELSKGFYETQYGLIRSRTVAREVIRTLGLEKSPEFRLRGNMAQANGLSREEMEEAKRVNRLLENLEISPVRNSRLVDVSYTSRIPALAARVSNRVAETYIAFNSAARYNTSERASASLAHQTANLQEEIEKKERELQYYAREHGIIPLDEKQDITLKNLNDLSNSFTRVQAERIEKEARFAALRDAPPESVPEVTSNELVQAHSRRLAELQARHAQLSETYKPDWPEMSGLRREIDEASARLKEETETAYGNFLGAVENAYRKALNEERYLESHLEDLKLESQELGLKEIEYKNLKSEIFNKRSTLQALVRRQSETTTTSELSELESSNIRIVDPAEVPADPSSPKIFRNLSLAILSSLGLGIMLSFLLEHVDKSVKTAEEIQHAARVPSIGNIPRLKSDSSRLRLVRPAALRAGPVAPSVELISHQDPRSMVSEAFKEIRTGLLVSRPGGPPRSVQITSARPGEGKTTVALNLAVTLTQIGRRVLLVDADMRKPRLAEALGVANTEGLSTALSAAASTRVHIVQSTIQGLDFLPSGPLPPNPADLLDSDRFVQTKSDLESLGYDHIIFDSPPVMAVADATIIAAGMDAVILVAVSGVTAKDALAFAASRLEQVKARLVGCVLNRVETDPGGYLAGYYGRSRPTAEEGAPGENQRTGSGGTA